MSQRKKVGVALSGGGMRGLAHIGVLRVLEEANIPIDMISGTSMGALIGSLYAAEPNAKKLEKEALDENISSLFDYTLSRYGLIKGNKIEDYLENKLSNISFKDLKIPLFITSFDIERKREVIFTKGDVAKAVRASISIPGVFFPVENKNEILVDGGVVDPVPTEILKKMGADVIIAINVNNLKVNKPILNEKAVKKTSEKKMPNMLRNALRANQITGAESSMTALQNSHADFVIDVDLDGVGLFEFKRNKYIIERGKKYAKASLKRIREITEENTFKSFLNQIGKDLSKTNVVEKVKKGFSEFPKNKI